MTATDATTVAIYARISDDDLGTEAGVRRQLEDGRQLAAQRGWKVVAEFQDNDVSAYNGAVRAGYRELMANAEAGSFARIIVWHTSRLWRSRTERAAAIGNLATARVSVVAVRGPDLDLSSAYGRGMAGLLGEFDTLESEVKSERVARAALQRAREGRANGQVAYGWRRVHDRDDRGQVTGWHDVEDPDTAGIVREIVDRLLAGEPLRAIRDDLNDRGVETPKAAGAWRSSTVRKIALRPANIAKRVHHGEVIGDAAWPAIVERERHDAVVALLADPTRITSTDVSAPRKHLLTYGIGQCGVCGSVLRHVVKRNRRYGKPRALYVCDRAGCVGRNPEPVDELVRSVVVARLAQPDAAPAFDDDVQALAEATTTVDTLRARLDHAAERFADGIIDGQQLATITTRLKPQLDEATDRRRQLARAATTSPILDRIDPERAGETWDELTVDERRAVLDVLGIVVRIMPTRQGPGFNPTDVQVAWEVPQ
jgi:site-specific DNA recombinase